MSKLNLSKITLIEDKTARGTEPTSTTSMDTGQTSVSKFFSIESKGKRRSCNTGTDDVPGKKKACVNADNPLPDSSKSSASSSLSAKTLTKLHTFILTDNEETTQQITPEVSFTKIKSYKNNTDVEMTEEDCQPWLDNEPGTSTLKEPIAYAAKFTPLELQYLDIKNKNPDVILFVECGYKFRFFGEDAKIAAKELNIYCNIDHNLMTASIPVHRVHVHANRLVAKGYKVGIVNQTETAALKAASENRSNVFTRELVALYSKGTLVGQDVEGGEAMSGCGGYIMTVTDEVVSGDLHQVAFVAADVTTGSLLYDCFTDHPSRGQLTTALTHLEPVEVLINKECSAATQRVVKQYCDRGSALQAYARLEILSESHFLTSDSHVTLPSCAQSLPDLALKCVMALVQYCARFGLTRLLLSEKNIQKFSADADYMKLDGVTLTHLDILRDQDTGNRHGSLLWAMDRTRTAFGSRLLQKWIATPLCNKEAILARQEAVQEIIECRCDELSELWTALHQVLDLEKSLTAAYHCKVSPHHFFCTCTTLQDLYVHFVVRLPGLQRKVKSRLLLATVQRVLDNLQGLDMWTKPLNPVAAKSLDWLQLFVQDPASVVPYRQEMASIHHEIQEHKKYIEETLGGSAFEYSTVQGCKYMIEVKASQSVPQDWVKVSGTKAMARYRTPVLETACQALARCTEQIKKEMKACWSAMIRTFEEFYPVYKCAVDGLAILDCLFSLAQVAQQGNYCRPVIRDDISCIRVLQGRHAVLELVNEQEQSVPNDSSIASDGERCMVITGPNMGGKSCYIKQVALLVIMAQIGSFVPAEAAEIGLVDCVYTRMGASDALYQGRSTFMVELLETARIIGGATDRSLVIVDELGRGTSTHDGVAIAMATLQHFLQVGCLVLFVTHYPPVVAMVTHNSGVGNYHMTYFLNESNTADETDIPYLTFLYQLVSGEADASYGLNVARLAGIPSSVISLAHQKATEIASQNTQLRKKLLLLQNVFKSDGSNLEGLLQQLNSI